MDLSVIIAVRDGARYLRRSLQSVLDQQGPAFEVVVVDDGSTDDTPAILDAIAARDARVTVVHSAPQGFTVSLGLAIARASGAYLARHDADDVSLAGRFERQWRYLDAHPDVAAVGTASEIIDEHDAALGPFPSTSEGETVRHGLLSLRATPVHGSMMMRRTAFDAVGGYRAAFRVAQDYDLWLRLSERSRIDMLPDLGYQWRLNPLGAYGRRRAEQLQYAGIARLFADERAAFGHDSYERLQANDGDFARFAEGYRLAGPLHALWGELLYRGVNSPATARTHLWRAVRLGVVAPRTLALLAWSALGLPWPGGRPLTAANS